MLNEFEITNAGAELLNQAMVSGDLIFTRGAIGSGALPAGSDLRLRTGMLASVSNMAIGSVTVAGGKTRVICQFTNVDGQGGYLPEFRWNETGLFAKLGENGTETLLAYANNCDAGKGDVIPTTACEFEIAFEIEFSGAEDVQFGSEGLIFATVAQLAGKANLGHTHTMADITDGFDFGSFDEETPLAEHISLSTAHANMLVDGNITNAQASTATLEEHEIDTYAHQNIIIDGNEIN